MKRARRAAVAVSFFAIALSGCESVSERQARILNGMETASGAISDVKTGVKGALDAGAMVVDSAQKTAQDLENRAKSVQEGVSKVQEGKKLIEEGLGIGN